MKYLRNNFLLFNYFITLPISKIVFSMIIMCMYDMFGCGLHWCHGAHIQVREQLCAANYLLLSSCKFWVSDLGPQICTTSTLPTKPFCWYRNYQYFAKLFIYIINYLF